MLSEAIELLTLEELALWLQDGVVDIKSTAIIILRKTYYPLF
jgi:hypothetical protein